MFWDLEDFNNLGRIILAFFIFFCTLWLEAPSQTDWAWRRHKAVEEKEELIRTLFVEQPMDPPGSAKKCIYSSAYHQPVHFIWQE